MGTFDTSKLLSDFYMPMSECVRCMCVRVCK